MKQGRVWVGIISRFPKHLFLMGQRSHIPHGHTHGHIFLLSAKHNNLYEAFVSEAEIPIADTGFDLIPMVEKGYSVGMLRQAETA